MKPLISILLVFAIGLFMAAGCQKHSSSAISGGGKGGSIALNIVPEHHDSLIDSCIIYIKYGTNDAPASGSYDDSASCVLAGDAPTATFHHLTPGLYYIYGQGYHSTYTPPYIKGGVPVTIADNPADTTVYLPTYSYQP